jgi:hypothetical protein
MKLLFSRQSRGGSMAKKFQQTTIFSIRHCERSEAIHDRKWQMDRHALRARDDEVALACL